VIGVAGLTWWKKLEARVRIELTYKGFADLSLTTWVPRPENLNYPQTNKMSTGSPKGAETEMTSQGSSTTAGSIHPAQNQLANTTSPCCAL
jgi:hypothetical protein